MFDIAAPKHHFIGFDGGDETGDDIAYIAPPLFFTVLLQTPYSDIVLEDPAPVRKMAEFHGFYDAIENQGGSEAGPQAQKKHLAAFIASQSLHGRVIDDLDRAPECLFKIKSDPSGAQVMRLRDRAAMENRPRVAD